MSANFSLTAESRKDQGKGASRRLRHAELVPAILYGANKAPQNISLRHKELSKALESEAFYTRIIKMTVDGAPVDVLLKDLQRHPARPVILHADFLRVDKNHKITLRIPLHFINEANCVGVKTGGGVISHSLTDLEIRCLPADLPEYIEVDMQNVQVGHALHISDLKLPKGVESVQLAHHHDLAVASVFIPRAEKAEETVAAATPEAGAAAAAPAAGDAKAAAPAADAAKAKK